MGIQNFMLGVAESRPSTHTPNIRSPNNWGLGKPKNFRKSEASPL